MDVVGEVVADGGGVGWRCAGRPFADEVFAVGQAGVAGLGEVGR